MTAEQMRLKCENEQYLAVVDATHPFATEVSVNIRESLKGLDIPYFRLGREKIPGEEGERQAGERQAEEQNYMARKYFQNTAACVEAVSYTHLEGEDRECFIKRTMKGFRQMTEQAWRENCGQIAAVVHGGSIMAILSCLMQDDYFAYQVPNLAGYAFQYEGCLLYTSVYGLSGVSGKSRLEGK